LNYYDGGIHGHRYGDWNFIKIEIDKLPISLQKKTLTRYGEIYRELLEIDPHRSRQRANIWLRKFVDKHKAVDNNLLPF